MNEAEQVQAQKEDGAWTKRYASWFTRSSLNPWLP